MRPKGHGLSSRMLMHKQVMPIMILTETHIRKGGTFVMNSNMDRMMYLCELENFSPGLLIFLICHI